MDSPLRSAFFNNRILATFLLVLTFVLAGSQNAIAAWSTGPTLNNAISTAANTQQFPTIISDGSGGAIITWQDYRGGATADIYAQRINASGAVQWTADVAISTAANNQLYPTIISDGSGGAIITWQDARGGSTSDIYAQRINSSGTVQWLADGVVISIFANNQLVPTIISDGSGGAIITWYDLRGGTNYDIYAQRINSSGVVQWTADGVAISIAANNQWYPTITSDGSGGAIITWQDYRGGATADIYAQRINASGVVQWTADGVAISTAASVQDSPTIISDGSGGAIITWYDSRSGLADIYAQRINSSGAVQWTADGVAISTAANNQWYPTITSDGSGGAIITWFDLRGGPTADIYAQRINASGAALWTADGVAISTAANNQLYPTIISDGSGGAIITWYDYRGGATADIYAQRINANGAVQWTADGVAISTAANDQLSPTIISDGSGGAIITWYDLRGGATADIYAQRINASGAVSSTVTANANANGNSTGTVASNVGGVSYTYPGTSAGTTTALGNATDVIVTATAGASSTASWAGTCTAVGGVEAGNGTTSAICAFSNLAADKTATATFTLSYTVSASAGAGGTISASQTVNHGSTTTFTVTPNAGYTAFVGGTCGGALVSNIYTTSAITSGCTVSATFTINTYTVTATAGAGGTISASQTVNHGSTTMFAVTPNAGYTAFVGGTCGGTLVGNIYTTSAITSACTVSATFTINSYTVSASAGAGGTISLANQTVNHGSTTTFTVTPNAGYTAFVGGTCGGTLVGYAYTTNAITSACTVTATFTQDTRAVTPSAGANGTINPATPQTVNHGSTTTFTVTPDAGYTAFVGGTCGGTLVGTTYITGAITGACTVTANFAQDTTGNNDNNNYTPDGYTVTATAGTNGSISPSGTYTVSSGTVLSFTVTPGTNYKASVIGCNGTLNAHTYTTGAIYADCTVAAAFTLNVFPAITTSTISTYKPSASPVLDTDPAKAKPIALGSIATGGDTLSIKIGLNAFAEAVDLYIIIYAPGIDKDNYYLLGPDNVLHKGSEGLVKWKSNQTEAIDESLFGDITTASLLSGRYELYLFATPVGSIDNYYNWQTWFVIP